MAISPCLLAIQSQLIVLASGIFFASHVNGRQVVAASDWEIRGNNMYDLLSSAPGMGLGSCSSREGITWIDLADSQQGLN